MYIMIQEGFKHHIFIIQCINYTPTCILFLLSLCEPLLVPNSIEHVRMRTNWFFIIERYVKYYTWPITGLLWYMTNF